MDVIETFGAQEEEAREFTLSKRPGASGRDQSVSAFPALCMSTGLMTSIGKHTPHLVVIALCSQLDAVMCQCRPHVGSLVDYSGRIVPIG